MKLVFDNVVYCLQRSGGVSRFWSKIIQPYICDNSSLFIDRGECNNNIYRQDIKIAPKVCMRDHLFPIKIARYLNFNQRFFDDKYVFHSSYFRINDVPGCLNITTVHDLIYEKFVSGIGSALHLHQKVVALHKSDCIVCVSEHTRKDLLEHYPFCSDKNIAIIPNGVAGFYKSNLYTDLFQRKSIKGSKSYFLYVGHRGGCKGFSLILDVLDYLEGSLQCVVVGDPFTSDELIKVDAWVKKKNILNVGRVSDTELNELYSHASFFFFPSLYEGFGIPPLEAMMSGCPVLASNRSSVPEVVGDAAILFDPADLASLKSGLSRVLQADVREKLIALGTARADIFSWESVVQRYAALYSRLL